MPVFVNFKIDFYFFFKYTWSTDRCIKQSHRLIKRARPDGIFSPCIDTLTFFGLSLLGDANSGISPIDPLLVKKEVKN